MQVAKEDFFVYDTLLGPIHASIDGSTKKSYLYITNRDYEGFSRVYLYGSLMKATLEINKGKYISLWCTFAEKNNIKKI